MSPGNDAAATGAATAPDIVECPVAEACGGCSLIGRPYELQLEFKRAVVADRFAGVAKLQARIDRCLPAGVRTGYRNRAKLAVRAARDAVEIGLYRRGTREIVDAAPCRVQSAPLLEMLSRIREWLGVHRLAAPRGPVKYVDLREAAEERGHVTFVLACEPDREGGLPIPDLVERVPELCGVSLNYNPRDSSYVFGQTTRTPWGNRSFLAAVPARSASCRIFEVPATGFFQVAPDRLPAIHEQMSAHLGRRGPLLDLYCGVGVHGLTLASQGGPTEGLVGIEESTAAAACARRNADRCGVSARFLATKVERGLESVLDSFSPRRIILNPGRAGCRPEVIEALEARGARRLAYLSCEPETLVRDAELLHARGWSITKVIPIDMMPQTAQVEALALFRPTN